VASIVVGFDGSDWARAALDKAIELGATFGDDVIVVYAYEYQRAGGEVTDYAAVLKERALEVVRHAKHHAAAKDVDVDTHVLEEDPAQALVDVAREHDARFIVVGSRGERPLKGVLVGSTPYKLIHLADRPVLIVPSE
jgi:nucleotide-binding universal stress UspA family protein